MRRKVVGTQFSAGRAATSSSGQRTTTTSALSSPPSSAAATSVQAQFLKMVKDTAVGIEELERFFEGHRAELNLNEGCVAAGLGPPLYHVCGQGDLPKLRWLIAHGANVNQRTILRPSSTVQINETPLITALSKGHPYLAQVLLEHGAMVNTICQTTGGPAAGASSSTKDFRDCSPLLIALRFLGLDSLSDFEALSSTTSTTSTTSSSTSSTPTTPAAEAMKQVIQLLIRLGAEVRGPPSTSSTTKSSSTT